MKEEKNLSAGGSFKGPFTLEKAVDSEWLITNGTGAFGTSTIGDCPTRKYHGLLVTPLPGREGRYHILSAVEASLKDDPDFIMASNYYPGVIHPKGYSFIDTFSALPFPRWIYSHGETSIKKELFMLHGETAVYLIFTLLEGGQKADIDLKFLFTFRNANYTTEENPFLSNTIFELDNGFGIRPYADLPVAMIDFSGDWKRTGEVYWDKNIEYPDEQRRGLDYSEDRFVPGTASITLTRNRPHVIRIGLDFKHSLEKHKSSGRLLLTGAYRRHLRKISGETAEIKSDRDILSYMGRHFIVKNSSGQDSINAGFPWFGEWGRDTMIALPGLTLCRGCAESGIDILSGYASLIRDGLLPNTLGESQGFTSYNSMDAGLLYCWALKKLIESGGNITTCSAGTSNSGGSILSESLLNKRLVRRIFKEIKPGVEAIVNAFINGSVPDARLESTGLIDTGSPDTQLTWMDATAWGKPVTSRHGLAVDLNALWYDSLVLLKDLLSYAGETVPGTIHELISSIENSFTGIFLINDGFELPWLTDTVAEGSRDERIRPNMLFAASSSCGLLSKEIRKGIVQKAVKHLLTPMGLRTLSPEDPDFAPEYSGNPDQRDSKYHQGTVWPWPLGIMIESSLMASEDLEKESVFWKEYLNNFLEKHLHRQGTGFISEIFDGSIPETGKGCFAQAWSTGEILRAYTLVDRALSL